MHIKGFKIELNKFLSISVSLTNIHHFKSMNGKAFLYEVLPYFFLHVHYFEEIRVMIIDFFLQNLNGSEYLACSTSDKFVIKWYSAYKGREETLFEYITGTIQYIGPEYIVLENNGIGYQIITPNPYKFKNDGTIQKVYTYLYVREDALTLYGFLTATEKSFFLKLLNVSGIGPRGALAILSAATPEQIALAIEQENEKILTTLPGVGKKTARQMILDLKGKVTEFVPIVRSKENDISAGENSELEEALLALQALGYSDQEIRRVKPILQKEKLKVDEYIRLALQQFIS